MSEVDTVEKAETPALENERIVFKKKPKKPLRQRCQSDEEDGDSGDKKTSLDDIKGRQKLRQRPNGISVVGLALGKKIAHEEEITLKDAFSLKSGGLVNMQALKSRKVEATEDAYDVSIGTQFSAETNKRDEDEEMMKYIEDELQKRKGLASSPSEADDEANKYLSPEDAALFALPDHLRQSSSNRSEEMLSNQMLNGIPEVDLGIEAKIKNIEATEEAKQKLLQEQRNKKDLPSQFVPTNMAVNFMQHNRFNIEESSSDQKRKQRNAQANNNQQQSRNGKPPLGKPQHVGPNGVKRATDDYHYDKFKKQFRRY